MTLSINPPFTFRRRVTRATGNTPQTAQVAIFTITGAIRMISLVGRITTAIGAVAVNFSIIANPTTGADSALCAVADLNAQPAGTILGLTGTLADAMRVSVTEGGLADMVNPIIVQPGTLDVLTSASITGQIEWTLTYEQVTSAGNVVAA